MCFSVIENDININTKNTNTWHDKIQQFSPFKEKQMRVLWRGFQDFGAINATLSDYSR
jgi:hypothetical protein